MGAPAAVRPHRTVNDESKARAKACEWAKVAHPRAELYFADDLVKIMKLIAQSIDPGDDAVVGKEDRCVIWQGEVQRVAKEHGLENLAPGADLCLPSHTEERDPEIAFPLSSPGDRSDEDVATRASGCGSAACQAVVRLGGSGDPAKETPVYVNRLLAFTFATEDAFKQLQRLPKAPFKMRCGNQRCINVRHILMET